MQALAIYFDEPGILDYPLNYTVYYDSYRLFSEFCALRGVKLYIVRGDSYLGKMRFSSGWHYQEGVLVAHEDVLTVDLVYVKGLNFRFHPEPSDLVMDDPIFDALASSKWETYQALSDLMIPTFQMSETNWQQVINQIESDKIVLKPDIGAGGEGVLIIPKEEFNYSELNLEGPYLAQPFVDSSAGIPGITDGYHDLRVLVFDNEPKLSFIRIPKEGSLLSNVALGGSMQVVPFEKIPQTVLTIVEDVVKRFVHFGPKVYSVDFLFANHQPYIVEINTRPGFPHPTHEGQAFTDEFYECLLTSMKKAASQNKENRD